MDIVFWDDRNGKQENGLQELLLIRSLKKLNRH